MITVAQVDRWRSEPTELRGLEFKEAKNSYDRQKLFQYCVAISNEGGGYLLLGIADGPPRPVLGTSAFPNIVAIEQDIYNKIGFRVDVEPVAHPDGRVLVFAIPSRPQGTAHHLEGTYLMRSGASLVAMSPEKLKSIFVEGQPEWAEQPSRTAMSAQDVVNLLDTQTFFDLLKQPYPTTQARVIEVLMNERLLDLADDGYAVRRIGALLLAKNLADFPDIARKAPRVIVYNGTNKLDVRLDQPGRRGYAVGFQALVDYVMAQMPQNEVIEDALRKKVKLLPDDGMRELIANALVHQDLTMGGVSPTIEIYVNRVEISNPGMPLVSVEHFIDGYQSRNERLAGLMRRMHICEERSSGVDRVVTLAEAWQLPAPYFGTIDKRTIAVVYGAKPFDDMDRDDRVRATYQHCVLKYVMSERMTNQSLRERFGLADGKQAVVSQAIAATVESKLIRPDESGGESRRYARYVPTWA